MCDDMELDMCGIVTTGVEDVPETRAFNEELERRLAAQTPIHILNDPAASRKARALMGGHERVPEAVDRAVGGVPVRVFVPPSVDGVFLHIHGGGYVIGSADGQDLWLWRLAREARVAVVSVDYRLAPENPYPCGPDDCERAALWLAEHAAAEFGADRLVIGGESAGACLAALTLLRLRDRHAVTGAFRAAHLSFGSYDLSMTPSVRHWGERNLLVSTPIIAWFREQYTPGMTPEERRSPEISPLYADLSGMPTARFVVGTMDPALDDTLFMAARWRAAGNAAELEVVAEAAHGFTLFPIAVAERERRQQVGFVRKAVATAE
ncbi:alpha/beta hydrolase fold domain-containing protein [Microbispora sp. NPDC046973]|uniref:alpha/beta hydrolase fold domain-containing protein n=1 Tax=Microbispora sp. NPDC046973 TaxID=3155022 RepID=UPI0033D89825